MASTEMLLEANRLSKSFGGLRAVDEVDFSVAAGSITGIIGPNGAGKTTFFNLISRALPASSGRITFNGRDVTALEAHQVARLGLARTFQATTLFGDATALENVLVGHRQCTKAGVLDALIRTRRLAREEGEADHAAREALDEVGLAAHAERRALDLTQEQQKRLAIALALVAKPRLLLLDEPSAGINAEQTRGLIGLIEKIAGAGVTVLLIEHQMQVVMQLCRRIMVLDYGKKIAEGTPDEIRKDPAVLDAYPGAALMLKVSGLSVSYGSFQAVRDIAFEVRAGELVVLLGANGAGKTTIFRALSGLTPPDRGSRIEWAGRDLSALSPRAIVNSGLSHCPEGRKLFPALSVGTNLRLGAYLCGDQAEIERRLARVLALFPLSGRMNDPAGALSGGQQQMVSIGRALMAEPKILLLDEPSVSLAPKVVEQVLDAVAAINRAGTMVLLSEQNAYAALAIAHRGYVLESGRIVLDGPAAELMQHDEVRRAYMGA